MDQSQKIYADLIADFLVDHKITSVFDLTGGMVAFLEDAISRKDGICCIPMHHEQAAGFAAEGFARKSGLFGVALATSGPGATNLMTAIGSCYFDSVPVLFITGQVHTSNIKKNNRVRQEGFQETDIVSMVKQVTKYSALITDVEDIIPEFHKAYQIMLDGRPGPVLLDIPINLQRTKVTDTKYELASVDGVSKVFLEESKISKLEYLLQNAQAPLLLVGHGVRIARAEMETQAFQKKNNLPVVSSLLGLDVFPQDKNFIGYIGSNGNRVANIVLANADLLIVVGSRLDLRQTGSPEFFNKDTKIVHIDIDSESIDYSLKSTLSFKCDVKTFYEQVEHIETTTKDPWQEFIHEVQNNFSRVEEPIKYVNPNLFFDTLSTIADKNTSVVIDVGQNQQWCAQSWKTKAGQRLLFSGGMGAMGFALPAAIGTWYADTNSQVIVVTGDGGLQINIQELETVSRNNIPLKIFVLNNSSLGMVREFQDTYLNKNNYTTVEGYGNPNFERLADAYSIPYVKITDNDSEKVVTDILARTTPVFVEVIIDKNAPLHPKVVYGHALDDQAPYLSEEKKNILESLKLKLKTTDR